MRCPSELCTAMPLILEPRSEAGIWPLAEYETRAHGKLHCPVMIHPKRYIYRSSARIVRFRDAILSFAVYSSKSDPKKDMSLAGWPGRKRSLFLIRLSSGGTNNKPRFFDRSSGPGLIHPRLIHIRSRQLQHSYPSNDDRKSSSQTRRVNIGQITHPDTR